jgi:hypothetical protein
MPVVGRETEPDVKRTVSFTPESFTWFQAQVEKDLRACPGMSSTLTSLTSGILQMLSLHPFFQHLSEWAGKDGRSWLSKIQQMLDVPSLVEFLKLSKKQGSDPVALFDKVLRLGLEALAAESEDTDGSGGGVEIGQITKVGSKKKRSTPVNRKGAVQIEDPK